MHSFIRKLGLLLLTSFFLFHSSGQEFANQNGGTESRSETSKYGPPKVIGTIKNESINESSGLVASRTIPGVYWTHNDSGDGPFLYAIGTGGESFGVWRVTGAEAIDWEDISIGPGSVRGKSYLYIGDIGDNSSARKEIVVYRVLEPRPTLADQNSTKSKPRITENAEAIRLRYPDGKHDAEALLVDPNSGDIYIVTKVAFQNPFIYEAAATMSSAQPITMKSLGELKVPSLFGGIITGGSVSPDGKRIALCDYFQGYEAVLPANRSNFEDIWKQRLVSFDFAKRKQGESIAYRLDGLALLGTSEGRDSPLIRVER
ncbi:MAG TPA: hypothetical protein VJ372_02405 [Pyrinomonadaceae bacterium]|jgi:hypothetical protein|nr:hypothetical protein [Pyrinomonadaceae bacterium]